MSDDYGRIVEYNNFLKTFPRASKIQTGYFYTYSYEFKTNYPKSELKYYDFKPLCFIFKRFKFERKVEKTQGVCSVGLNFHHLPIKARQWWLNKIKVVAFKYFEKGGIIKIPGLNEDTLPRIMKKSSFGFRNYDEINISNLRQIRLEDLDEVMKFYGKTYYGVTIKQIQAKYANFIP